MANIFENKNRYASQTDDRYEYKHAPEPGEADSMVPDRLNTREFRNLEGSTLLIEDTLVVITDVLVGQGGEGAVFVGYYSEHENEALPCIIKVETLDDAEQFQLITETQNYYALLDMAPRVIVSTITSDPAPFRNFIAKGNSGETLPVVSNVHKKNEIDATPSAFAVTVMEYIPGNLSLDDLLEKGKIPVHSSKSNTKAYEQMTLTLGLFRELISSLGEFLDKYDRLLRESRIPYQGDIKPENILVSYVPGLGFVFKFIDFGLNQLVIEYQLKIMLRDSDRIAGTSNFITYAKAQQGRETVAEINTALMQFLIKFLIGDYLNSAELNLFIELKFPDNFIKRALVRWGRTIPNLSTKLHSLIGYLTSLNYGKIEHVSPSVLVRRCLELLELIDSK